MRLFVRHHYEVPKDLAQLYNKKIAEINKWLEDELITRGVKPDTARSIVVLFERKWN